MTATTRFITHQTDTLDDTAQKSGIASVQSVRVFRHCLLLTAICLATFFAGLGRSAIGDSDEAFYAESAREMVESGDWVTPHYNYEYRFQKPILYYWLVSATYRVWGIGEAAARFPSALAALALTLMTFACGRRWFGPRTGLVAGLIVATSFGYFPIARSALPDLPLAFFISLATWTLCEALLGRPVWPVNHGTELSPRVSEDENAAAGRTPLMEIGGGGNGHGHAVPASSHVPASRTALPADAAAAPGRSYAVDVSTDERLAASITERGWWLIASAASMGLGLLTKGPVAVALPVMIVLPLVLMARKSWKPTSAGWLGLSWRHVMLGAAVFLAVAVPWFAAMVATHGTAYLDRFFVGENFERFATDKYNDRRPIWFYVPILLAGLAPWSPFVFLGIPTIKRVLKRERRGADAEWRAVLWAAVPFLFYTLSIGQQPRYILPVLPPLALIVAHMLVTRIDKSNALAALAGARQRNLALAICASCTAVGLIVLAVLLYRARPLLFALSPTSGLIGTAVIVAASVGLLAVAWFARHSLLPAALAAASVATLLALNYSVYSAAGLEPVQRMARLYARERQNNEPSATYKAFVRNLVFYTNVKQTNLIDDRDAIEFLKKPERVLCVLPEDALRPLESQHGVKVKRLASVTYFNPSGVRLRTLLDPEPERDLETVWLISNQ
jgi:4-amino-4-deoxy-L-arabinose transferase-like glycosyltransferase